jgi:GTP-binding protein
VSTGEVNPNRVERVDHPRPLVALVGRPNVGKSTLFNRLVQARWAITDDRPGVTRDRIYAVTEWQGRRLTLVDTGGYVPHGQDSMEAAVRAQAERAVAEADVVLLVCDIRAGLTDLDRELAHLLRQGQVACIVVANKADTPEAALEVDDFRRLGLGEPFAVSAATGRRSGDLLETVLQRLGDPAETAATAAPDEAIKVVLAGRPNVGKSTLVNRLAGEEVSIVDDAPGTTRDTTSIRVRWQDRTFEILDTAGLRRRSRVEDAVEFYSSRRASDTIEAADVVIALIDAVEGWTVQDARIIGQAVDAGRGLVVAANKWDLVAGEERTAEGFVEGLRDRFPFLVDYPVVTVSGLSGKRVHRLLEWAAKVHENRHRRIQTARLNEFLERVTRQQPPFVAGAELRFFYATQRGVAPPTFIVFTNHPELVSGSYQRLLEKRLREEYDLLGTPVRFLLRGREGRD